MSRTYIPKDSGVTDDYAIRLDRTLILPNVKKEFYHENIEKEKQLISGTFDVVNKTIQLDFKPDRLLKFLLSLENEPIKWLQKNKQFLSIRAIEKYLEMPDSTLIKAVNGTQNLPKRWLEPLRVFIIGLQNQKSEGKKLK
jgi:hypothetical protein